MMSYWSRVDPESSMTGVLIRSREETQRHRHTRGEATHVRTEAAISQGMPRVTNRHQNLREGHGSDFCLDLQRKYSLADTSILDHSLQNWERIHFCCLKVS